MNYKKIMAICVPSAAAAVTVAALALTVCNRNRTITSLRTQLAAYAEPEVPEETQPFFEPVAVMHNYDRAGNKIYLKDDTFGQIWLPVLSDVALTKHPLENLCETEDKRVVSLDDEGNVNVLTGVDLSAHNTVNDWNAVREDGIDFVMLRVGYRGYGTGHIKADESFDRFYQGAKSVGLKVGAYFYSQAVTEEEAVEEAVFTAEHLYGYELDFPVAFDWELVFNGDKARTDYVPVDVLTNSVLAFCQNIESFGYQPMYYQNKRTSLLKLDLPRLQGIPFWLAEYGDGPTYIYDYDMWQYSSTAEVAGISGDVDLNVCFYDYSQEGAPTVALPAPENLTPIIPQTTTTYIPVAPLPETTETTSTTTETTAAETTSPETTSGGNDHTTQITSETT